MLAEVLRPLAPGDMSTDSHVACRQVDPGGPNVTGFFTTDFKVPELKQLAAVQPFAFRDHSLDGEELQIVTLDEIFEFWSGLNKSNGAPGLYMELKHPDFHASLVRFWLFCIQASMRTVRLVSIAEAWLVSASTSRHC